MHEQAFKTLEFETLCGFVRAASQTRMGEELVEALRPFDDDDSLRSAHRSVAELVELRRRGVKWSFSGISSPHESLALLRIEGTVIEPLGLLNLARLCGQALEARALIFAERDSCTTLSELVAHLPRELNSIVARVTSKILPSGELDDRASPELARIRSDITRLRSHITRTLENLMRRSEDSIQDELVTVRNDRFVIPVKSDHRGRVNGVAHGFSSSGATVFVEPLETIESNNELQALRENEEREIHKILLGLTDLLRAELSGIEMAARAVAQLDFVGAKASFFKSFDCVIPEISTDDSMEFVDARHPLLEENLRASRNSVVPVSLSLNTQHPVMVISGANAGGKTVVLKTAGLLSLMALSGLPVPARSARVPFYRSVLADIGDHQSLAANLSTFTSHVSNIAQMIDICERPALVLLDEVGTGTDPEEGSALGVAIVDYFRRTCGAYVLATTHYSGLKMYAANEDAVLNASVEFDEKTLKPTYRLLVGVAGASSGLEIAKRFGIRDTIIAAATDRVAVSSREATEYLRTIKREAEEAENLRRALEEEREAVAEKYASLDAAARRRETERQKEFESSMARAASEFERRATEVIKQVEDNVARARLERQSARAKSEIRREAASAVQSHVALAQPRDREVRVIRGSKELERKPVEAEEKSNEEFKVGDHVRLRSFGSIGVIERINDEDAEVRVKSLRFREKVGNLDLVKDAEPETDRVSAARLRVSRGTEVKLKESVNDVVSELNLIGRTSDEAVETVDKYLDEAFLNGITSLRIIHGHGTGALRRAIAELLRGHPHVERFRGAPPDQGGGGATLVELKQ
jgi:DNA mismatch repair protein MutS2